MAITWSSSTPADKNSGTSGHIADHKLINDNLDEIKTAVTTVESSIKTTRPALPFVVTYSGSSWQYKGATITARPGDMQAGDIIYFVGNPGGSLPAWAATNDIWTQG